MMRGRRRSGTRYRVFLINPRFRLKHYAAQHELSRLFGKRKVTVPLALPILAALTPDTYDVRIIDDEDEDIPWGERPDLVGITTTVTTADRAYEIADIYRALGVPVVLGGSYVTFVPDEALAHADSVVVGEAEGAWQRLLEDFERGSLARTYQAAERVSYARSPVPRWDLVDTSAIMTIFVHASRGCPFNCEFCLVQKMFGRKMRCRDIDDVISEIEALPLKTIFFADDNLTLKRPWAKELMRRLRPLGISFICQASVDVADDEELLGLMAAAGCVGILVGFESLDPDALRETRKTQNKVQEYEGAVRRIHSHGIHVFGSFVVGFDADTLDTFDAIVDFVERNDMMYPILSILAVAPGTDIHDRMRAAGRLTDVPNQMINGIFPGIHYARMSQVELLDRYQQTLQRLLMFESAGQRVLRLARSGWFRDEGSSGVGIREKLVTSLRMLRAFLLSPDPARRRVFFELFDLHRQGLVAMDRVVMMLLTIEANARWMESTDGLFRSARRRIAAQDRGPWLTASREGEGAA
jgi:radical SAM superfamily enzyme YgiQ (UPF0313 family)